MKKSWKIRKSGETVKISGKYMEKCWGEAGKEEEFNKKRNKDKRNN